MKLTKKEMAEYKEAIDTARAKGLIAGEVPQPKAPKPVSPMPESWASLLKEEFDKDSDITGVSFRRKVVRRVRDLAAAGVPWAVEFCANREEGKPKQQVDLDAKGGGLVQVQIVKFADIPEDKPQ